MSVNWEEIIKASIEKLKQQEGFFSDDLPEQSAQYYYLQGEYLYNQNKLVEAIEQFNRAIALDENYYLAYFYRGATEIKLGKIKSGIKDYDRAIELCSDFTDGYYFRAIARKKSGDLVSAIADLNETIELSPKKTQAYFELATCYSYLGDYQQAILNFTQLLHLDTTANTYYHRGVIYYLAEEYYKAIADLNKAIELNPDLVAAYYNLSNAYYQVQDCKKASSIYRLTRNISAELDSQNQYSHYAKGIAEISRENIAKGIDDLRQAASICREVNDFALNLKINFLIQNNQEI